MAITDTPGACDWCGAPLEGEIVTLSIRDQRYELCSKDGESPEEMAAIVRRITESR